MIEKAGTGIVLAVLLSLATPLFAQSGIFYDPDRDGEGALVMRDKTYVAAYVFTYDDGGDQVWYFFADEWNDQKNESTGFIYRAQSVNWPMGEPQPDNPFGMEVGEAVVVGIYILEPSKTGYRMVVLPFGDELDENDPLFERVHDWTFHLFEPQS